MAGWPAALHSEADDGVNWADLCDAFIDTLPPATARSYRTGLRLFFEFTGKAPSRIAALDVLNWRKALDRSASTVRTRLAAVSTFFQFLMQPRESDGRSYVAANPAAAVKRPKVEMFNKAVPVEESALKRMLAILGDSYVDQRTRTWIIVHLLTGRRRAEIARMRWEDREARAGTPGFVYRRKGGIADWCELPEPVVRALEAWRGDAQEGSVWGCVESTLVRALKRAAVRAGLDSRDVRPHGFRHLAAKIMFERVKDVKRVQRWLRHESSATTDIYLQHLNEERNSWADDVARLFLEE